MLFDRKLLIDSYFKRYLQILLSITVVNIINLLGLCMFMQYAVKLYIKLY